MNTHRFRLAVLAVVSIVLTLLIELPAAWFAPLVGTLSQGRLLAVNAEGSVWKGSTELALQGDAGPLWLLPGRLAWHLPLADWLQLRPGLRLEDAGLALQPWHPQLRWRHWQLGSGSLRLPLQGLAGMGLPWSSLGLSGYAILQWNGVSYHRGRWQGDLQIHTEDLQSALAPDQALGPFRLDGQLDHQAIDFQVQTLGGPMHLAGSGRWDGHSFRFPLQAQCDEACGSSLGSLLQLASGTHR